MKRLRSILLVAVAMFATFIALPSTARADDPPTQADLDASYSNGQMSAFMDSQVIISDGVANGATYYDIAIQFQTVANNNAMQRNLFGAWGALLAVAYFEGREAVFRAMANLYFSLG